MSNSTALALRAEQPKEADNWNDSISERKSKKDVAETAKRISGHWFKARESLHRVAADCAYAMREYSRSERQELIKQLPFGGSMFSKLAAIGSDGRLKELQERLPVSISKQYLITKLSDELLDAAVTEGIVKPDLKRNELERWKKGKCEKSAQDEPPAQLNMAADANEHAQPATLYCLYSKVPLDVEADLRVKGAIVSLADAEGIQAADFTGENLIADLRAFLNQSSDLTR